MTISDHSTHTTAVPGCFRCEVGTVSPMPKDAMDTNVSFRVSRELRDAAQAKAAERHENVSDVLRAALEDYAYGDDADRRRA